MSTVMNFVNEFQKLAIEELHEKLTASGIPHEYEHIFEGNPPNFEWNSITYPSRNDYVGDFVQHYHVDPSGKRTFGTSYGADENLMEGMGFDITPETANGDTVRGWIGLDEAFEMILKAHKKEIFKKDIMSCDFFGDVDERSKLCSILEKYGLTNWDDVRNKWWTLCGDKTRLSKGLGIEYKLNGRIISKLSCMAGERGGLQ